MILFHVLMFIEPATGLVVAAVATLVAAERRGRDTTARRVVSAIAVLAALTVLILWHRWAMWPWFSPTEVGLSSPSEMRMISSLLPLALAVPLIVVFAWPAPRRGAGSATLEPRGILTVTRPWWIAGLGVVLAITTALALAAGFASSPDENGHYTMYVVEPASEISGGTTIWGWYFSIPAGIAVAVLLVATVGALALIARAPLSGVAEDRLVRLHRARNVVATTAGALLCLLGEILGSLGGTASLTMSFRAGETGMVTVVGAFAALGPALSVTGTVVGALGFALWWFVALAALRARRLPDPA